MQFVQLLQHEIVLYSDTKSDEVKAFDKNEIYDIHRSKIEKLFYNDCFPDTFSYLNSLKQIDYLTLNKKDETKIKKATEQLHSMFISATEHVLKDKSLYKIQC